MYQQREVRGEKKDSGREYNRNPGRLGGSAHLQYKRVSSGKVGGGTATCLPPPSSSSNSSSASSPSLVYRIVKKPNVEVKQSRVASGSAESVSGCVQSEAPTQTSLSETSGAPTFDAAVKSINTYDQENIGIATKGQSSHSASGILDAGSPKTLIRDNISKGESVQFGSLRTGCPNGMQAWHGSSEGMEYFPTPKQPQWWEIKDLHIQQPQFQHPGMPFSSYQIPMPFPGGNASRIWHPPFVPGFQPRPLPHQGPFLNFPPPIHNYQMRSQFGKSTASRPVKITHPETHEELRFDEKVDSGMPSYHRGDFQPQPFYYSPRNHFSHVQPNPFLQTSASVLLTNSQMPPDIPTLGQKSSGMCSTAVSPNRVGELISSRSSASVHVPSESQIHSKFSSKQSTFVPRPTSSVQLSTPASCKTTSDVIPSRDAVFIEKNVGAKRERTIRVTKTAPVHSQHIQHMSSQTLADETSQCNVATNTNNELLKTAKRDDDGPLKANPAEQHSLNNKEDIGVGAIGSTSEVVLSVSESKQPVSAHSPNSSSSSSTSFFKVKGKASEEGSVSNMSRVKSAFSKRREKRKENIKKADGETADLYMACREPKKKLETSGNVMQVSSGFFEEDAATNQDHRKNATEISTQKLETSSKAEVDGKRRYSIDFLLSLSSNFTDLPTDFKPASDAVENLLCSNAIVLGLVNHSPKGPNPSISENVSRTGGISRLEYRAIGVLDNARRTKPHSAFASGPEPSNDANQSVNYYGIRSGQRRVARNLLVHAPNQYGSGLQRGSRKWQRASRSLKGLVPSQSPLQVMHKAEKKYEVRKVNDDVEEGKQRQLKAILNKLTPQNFERLFQQVKEVTIDNAATLAGVISQIFDKALMEPTFCEMYVDFCYHLASELPDFVEDDQRITFKRLLLNKCQEEFERGEREQAEAEKVEGDGEFKQSDHEREEKRIQARRRMLGNIRLIGELYKNKMLTERIMHECIQKLLGHDENPDEEDIEALCNLMCTIGEMIDHAKSKSQMDTYFEILSKLSNNTDLSSRLRFMLMDVIDLRKNNWHQRRKVEGPKKIEELHRDAHQERQAQTGRLTRAPDNIPSPRRGQPLDIDDRATTMLSKSQIDPFHGMPSPSHIHGLGTQDVRLEHKYMHEIQASSLPSPRMSANDNTSYLSPWEGTRGMSSCSYGLQSFVRPSVCDRSIQQGSALYARRDAVNLNCSFGRSSELSSSARLQTHRIAPKEKVLPEECLAELSISAIREFYSAVDEDEVVLCIRELSSPSFLPKLVSLWVNDSFERKDRDRILLSRLLVNLTKSRGILDSGQLIQGFESVLATLEDAITDAPKAAAFLGSMFGKMITEDVISLGKIVHLVRESSKKHGHLQIGLAREVLENTFEMIKSEKGESFLREICMSSNVEWEDFAPRNLPNKLVSQ